MQVFLPATVTGDNIYQALDLKWDDFEDSVQYIVGEGLAVDYIITRNAQDFSNLRSYAGSIKVVTPEQFLKTIAEIEE